MQVKANQQLVTACCGQSRRAGVRPGMTVAHARALLSNPVVIDVDPGRDRRLLERLARWMMRFSPFVAIDRTFEQDERAPVDRERHPFHAPIRQPEEGRGAGRRQEQPDQV